MMMMVWMEMRVSDDDDGDEDGNDGDRQRFVVKMKLPGNQAATQLVSEATRHQVT